MRVECLLILDTVEDFSRRHPDEKAQAELAKTKSLKKGEG